MHGDADSEQVVVTGWTVPNDRATEVVRESLRRGSTLAEAVLSRGIQVTAAHLCASGAQIDGDIPIVDIDRGYGVPYDRSIGAARLAQLASQSVAAVIEDTLAGRGDPVLDPPAGIIGPLYHDDRILWGCALETADDAAILASNLRWMTHGYPTNVLIVADGVAHLAQGSEVDGRWIEDVATDCVGVMIGVFDEESYLVATIA